MAYGSCSGCGNAREECECSRMAVGERVRGLTGARRELEETIDNHQPRSMRSVWREHEDDEVAEVFIGELSGRY